MIRHCHGPPPRLENGSFLGPALELEEEHGNGKKFFRIIHPQTIRDRKLVIPMKFLRKFGKDLSDFYLHKARFSVLVNGKPGRLFTSHRGVRQGDPASPYLFLIAIETLSLMLSSAASQVNESLVKPKSSTIIPVSGNKDEPKNIDASALMQAASQFKSEHPFFTVQMKPSYVNHKFLPVLSTFDKSHMPGDRGWIKIQGSDGQEWSVGVLASENKKEYRLSKGISSFLADNNLKEGDVCVFELITENESDIMLKAHIFQ